MNDVPICPIKTVRQSLSPVNRTFLDYYLSLKAGTSELPCRCIFEPWSIPSILGQIVIYERRGPMDFRIRLFGTRVVERLGYDATNTNLMDIVDYAQKDRIGAIFHRLLDDRLGHWALVRDRFVSGRMAKVEIIRLPFLDRYGKPNLIFSATEEIETTGYAARGDKPVLLAERIDDCLFSLAPEAAVSC